MDGRWGISIDIEGFSHNYELSEARRTFAIQALSELMASIYSIGVRCFSGCPENNDSDRLFVHQFGDGFLICSDFPEENAQRAVAIAVALMRHMIIKGYAAKAGISTGSMSDIKGCYPAPMRESEDSRVSLGAGLMTIVPVMGTALTKAHKLAGKVSGAVVVLDPNLKAGFAHPGISYCGEGDNCINWIESEFPLADEISSRANLRTASPSKLYQLMQAYCLSEPKPLDCWVKGTFHGVKQHGA